MNASIIGMHPTPPRPDDAELPDTWWSRLVPTMLIIVVVVCAAAACACGLILSRFNDDPPLSKSYGRCLVGVSVYSGASVDAKINRGLCR